MSVLQMFVEGFGFTASLLLSVCAFPQAIKACIEKHAHGYSGLTLLMWLAGELLVLIYIFLAYWLFDAVTPMPVFLNYVFGAGTAIVIARYKVWPKVPNPNGVKDLPKWRRWID